MVTWEASAQCQLIFPVTKSCNRDRESSNDVFDSLLTSTHLTDLRKKEKLNIHHNQKRALSINVELDMWQTRPEQITTGMPSILER